MYLKDSTCSISGFVCLYVLFLMHHFLWNVNDLNHLCYPQAFVTRFFHMIHSVDETLQLDFIFENLNFSFPASFQFGFSLVCLCLYWILCLYPELCFIFNCFFLTSLSFFLSSLSSFRCSFLSSLNCLNTFNMLIIFVFSFMSWTSSKSFFLGTIILGWIHSIFFCIACVFEMTLEHPGLGCCIFCYVFSAWEVGTLR